MLQVIEPEGKKASKKFIQFAFHDLGPFSRVALKVKNIESKKKECPLKSRRHIKKITFLLLAD